LERSVPERKQAKENAEEDGKNGGDGELSE
jgi:hypothetical protein